MRVSFVWLAIVIGASASARADVIGPPPASCPDGSVVMSRPCHGGPYCVLDGCLADAECGPGERCVAAEMCVTTRGCGGRGGGETVSVVVASGCTGCIDRCESHFVCQRGATEIDAGRRDVGTDGGRDHVTYCGCTVPSRSAATPSAVITIGLGMLVTFAIRRATDRRRR